MVDVGRGVFAENPVDTISNGEVLDLGAGDRVDRGTLAHAVDDALKLAGAFQDNALHEGDILIVVAWRDEHRVAVVSAGEASIDVREVPRYPNGFGIHGAKTKETA